MVESFETSIPFAEEINADLIISSDPDADRIGVMARHNNAYEFVNGNEIGIVLTNYVISKYKAKGTLDPNSVVIKTGVTTSLIEGIAQENNIHCIGDLLVGFKYIGDEMNKLENDHRIQDFIIGAEESHGILTGDYCRDKDAAGAAVWIAELAAELKKETEGKEGSVEKIDEEERLTEESIILEENKLNEIERKVNELNIKKKSSLEIKEKI